jgi:hypothetical protein
VRTIVGPFMARFATGVEADSWMKVMEEEKSAQDNVLI